MPGVAQAIRHPGLAVGQTVWTASPPPRPPPRRLPGCREPSGLCDVLMLSFFAVETCRKPLHLHLRDLL